MKKVAERHGLVCLLHEKPFAGINGSGKHINWSMATDDGTNLLKPGKDPISNTQFLLFLSAVIKAVDEYQDLLRISVSGASNDHRLGGNEAPPSIISIFLGDDLLEVMEAVAESKSSLPRKARMMDTKASVLPDIKKDTTDRNRTSPFAFTGSRFEYKIPRVGKCTCRIRRRTDERGISQIFLRCNNSSYDRNKNSGRRA